jgi:hypothetical protein
MLYVGEMRITSAKIASVSPCRYRLNSEIEHQTRKNTTTGPVKPEGQRGAIKADTRPDDLESRDGAQGKNEQSSLIDDGVQAFRDRQRHIVDRKPLSLGAALPGATLAWTISQRTHSAASRDDE